LGNSSLPPEILVYVLHGYGMQAKKFIHEFESIVKPGVWIVAPEGLSRFYRKGFGGEVVASWMTSDDRLLEIDDYVAYLDAIDSLLDTGNRKKTILLGFSQGVATASRWISKGKLSPDEFVIWCGQFAPDTGPLRGKLPVIHHVYALQDEFINQKAFNDQSELLKAKGFQVENYEFEGTHSMNSEILMNVFQSIDNKFY